jgi:predicted CXXCH cytochrome family protein
MAFRLRQIVYSAGGRRIARDRMIESDRLTLGRAADNAIQIPDLAVEPHHAVITRESAGRVVVRATGTLGFALDGKAVREATLDLATSAELRFGSTAMTIARDADGEALIEVQARDGAAEAADPVAEKARFSLGRVMLSSRTIGWGLVLAVLVLFLALPVVSHALFAGALPKPGDGQIASRIIGDKAWSPGALSLAHHTLSNRCEACHVKGFQSVRNATCMACHKDVHDHAAPDRLGLARGPMGAGQALLQRVAHSFGREPAGACTDCHVEHQGPRAMDAPRQQFCADCHAGLAGRLPHTPLGNAADFGTSHPEFRAWIVTNAQTRARTPVSLAAHPQEDTGLTFSHRIHLDGQGGVAKMALTLGSAGYGKALQCADCHHPASDGVGFAPTTMEHDCEACHSLVYAKAGSTLLRLRHGDIPQMVADLARAGPVAPIVTGRARPGDFGAGGLYGAHFGAGPQSLASRALSPGGICGECHKPELRGGQMHMRPVTQVSRYMPNGWFDHAAHRQTACADCHAAAKSNAASDVLLPQMASCRSCHLGEDATRPKIASNCVMCHGYHPSAVAPAAARHFRHAAEPRVLASREGDRHP